MTLYSSLKGHGTKLFIGQSAPISSPEVFTEVGGIVGVNPPEASVPEINDTDFASEAEEFLFGLVDYGQATVTLKYRPADPVIRRLDGMAGTSEKVNFYILFSDGTTKWAFQAMVKTFTPAIGGHNEIVKSPLVLRVTGAIDKTYGS